MKSLPWHIHNGFVQKSEEIFQHKLSQKQNSYSYVVELFPYIVESVQK